MPQPAFQVDVLQIEPGSGTTQTVGRNAVSGDLKFVSPAVPAGIDLLSLAGLRNMAGVYLVGKSGSGAPYTTIQDAINAVNGATSSAANPALILVGPGIYTELLTIQKDGLFIVGLGGVTIDNGVATDHTITVNNGAGTPPQQLVFQNLRVTNDAPNYACIRLAGGAASNIGLVTGTAGGVWINGCHLANTAAGGYTVWATAINNLYLQGGTQTASDPNAILRVEQCAFASLDSVTDISVLRMDYNSGGTIPATAGSAYRASNCPSVGQLVSTLLGTGNLSILRCTTGTVTLDGDQTASIQHSVLGNISIGTTLAATLTASTRGTATGAGTLAEPVATGTLAFVAASSATFAFDVAGPDASYTVSVELPSAPASNAVAVIENKAAADFDVVFRDAGGLPIIQTMVVNVTIFRVL